MDWKDVGTAVKTAVPILSTVLTGGVGTIASAAGSLIASFLGCDDSPEAVDQAIKQNPETLLKLKELEAQEQDRLLKWKEAQLNAELADRESARNRDVELTKAGEHNYRADFLAAMAIIVFAGVLCALFNCEIPQGGTRDVIVFSIGHLSSFVKDVYAFEFGSSRGEQNAKINLK